MACPAPGKMWYAYGLFDSLISLSKMRTLLIAGMRQS